MIYLAVPYTSTDLEIVEERFEKVTLVAGKLYKIDKVCFSPITHCHEIAKRCVLPTNWEFWEKIDKVYLSKCDEMYILTLDGWKESRGVNAEIKIAKSFNIPIHLIDEELNITPYVENLD